MENHVCFVLKNLKLVNHQLFSSASKSIEDLPRIYVNNSELLSKPKRGKYVVSIMSLVRKFGSFSGIVLDIRHMLNFSGWNSAWLVLLPCQHSWFIILEFPGKRENDFYGKPLTEAIYILLILIFRNWSNQFFCLQEKPKIILKC